MNIEKLKAIIEGLRQEVEFERVEAAKWMQRYDERIDDIKEVNQLNQTLENRLNELKEIVEAQKRKIEKLTNDVLWWKGESKQQKTAVEILENRVEKPEEEKDAAPQTGDAELPMDVCLACVHQVCAFPERDREDHKRGFPTTGFLQCGLNRMFKPKGKCSDFSRRPEGFNRKTIYV